MATEWIFPPTLPQCGNTEDLNTPLFGLKVHVGITWEIGQIMKIKKDKRIRSEPNLRWDTMRVRATSKDGDWYLFKLEAGYYEFNMVNSGLIYYKLTNKGYLIEMDLIEVYEDFNIKPNTLEPYGVIA